MYRGNFSSMLIKKSSENSKSIRQLQSNSPSLKKQGIEKEYVTPGLEQIKLFNTDDAPVWVKSTV